MKQAEKKFFTEVTDGDEYDEIAVDGRVFYERREKGGRPRRRYSDQFKDPGFKAKELCRKLLVLRKERESQDIEGMLGKLRDVIIECSKILNKEAGMEPSGIYTHFNLRKMGMSGEDFGVLEDD